MAGCFVLRFERNLYGYSSSDGSLYLSGFWTTFWIAFLTTCWNLWRWKQWILSIKIGSSHRTEDTVFISCFPFEKPQRNHAKLKALVRWIFFCSIFFRYRSWECHITAKYSSENIWKKCLKSLSFFFAEFILEIDRILSKVFRNYFEPVCKTDNWLFCFTGCLWNGHKSSSPICKQHASREKNIEVWKHLLALFFNYSSNPNCLPSLSEFSTCTNPIIHLFYPPKFCIIIVCNFSWDPVSAGCFRCFCLVLIYGARYQQVSPKGLNWGLGFFCSWSTTS